MKRSPLALLSFSVLAAWMPVAALALSVTVMNTGDSGAGSLRQAITDVNATSDPTNFIGFDLGNSPPYTLSLASSLPALDETVLVDGFSQPGSVPGTPAVILDGASVLGFPTCLRLLGDDCVVRGLDVRDWGGDGIRIIGTNNVVAGCHVIGSGDTGILIIDGTGSTIGGTTVAERNVVSGSGYADVEISGPEISGHRIIGNYIGTDATGLAVVPTEGYGVIVSFSPSNTIGGASPAERNVIAGQSQDGIVVSGESATGNMILGNYLGVDATGSAALGIEDDGIYVNNAPRTTIGGLAAGEGNIIGGCGQSGIYVNGSNAIETLIAGNFIGTDSTGMIPLSNGWDGVRIRYAPSNTVGGAAVGARNIICASSFSGISIYEASAVGNVVQGNFVGVGADGVTPLPNGWSGGSYGAVKTHSADTLIGGVAPGEGNVISGNQYHGIHISGTNAIGNRIMGNRIGLAADGVTGVGNGQDGVYIGEAVSNVIGGVIARAGNFIAYNTHHGVNVHHSNSVGNAILGNAIYSNGWQGIDLGDNHLVETNDYLDGDIGPNGLQNYPLLYSATFGSTVIEGQLVSKPNASYRLEFFASHAADATGHGEGRAFLGWTSVLTGPTGEAGFSATVGVSVAKGHAVTATATDSEGNTSEFSLFTEIVFADADNDQIEDGWEGDHSLSSAVPNVGDSDSDGFSDLQEFHADTHPKDSNDFLRVTALKADAIPAIYFPSSSARLYRLKGTAALDTPANWQFIGAEVPGNGGDQFLAAPPGGERGFYHVEAHLP